MYLLMKKGILLALQGKSTESLSILRQVKKNFIKSAEVSFCNFKNSNEYTRYGRKQKEFYRIIKNR